MVLVALSVWGVLYLRNSQEAARQNEAIERADIEKEPAPMEGSAEATEGSYVGYSEPALDSTSGRRVLFFHAPWCPQCRMIEADIEKSTIPAGITIFKVDYDSNQALRQEYGVTLQTTFVELDENGELAAKYVAYNEPTFESLNDNLLER